MIEKVKLETVFTVIKNGASIKQSDNAGGIPITRIETISQGEIDYSKLGYADIESDKYADYYLENGDILMSHINSWTHLGKTALAKDIKGKLIHGMNLLVLRSDRNILIPAFAKYFFESNSFKEQLDKISNQSVNQSSFAISKLKTLDIPLPPLSIQQEIATLLDKADALRRKDRELLQAYEALAQAIFMDMFGDPVTNEKGWKVKRLGEVCDKITDGTHDTPERLTKGVKFITGKHIRPFVVDYDNSDYVTEEVHTEIYRRCNPMFGDILYTNIGVNYATAAMNTVDYEFSMKNVALLKFKRGLLTGRFLEFLLNNERFKNKLRTLTGIGGAQQFLSLAQIKSIEVLLPSIELQKEFENKVNSVFTSIYKVNMTLLESEHLFQTLLQTRFSFPT